MFEVIDMQYVRRAKVIPSSCHRASYPLAHVAKRNQSEIIVPGFSRQPYVLVNFLVDIASSPNHFPE